MTMTDDRPAVIAGYGENTEQTAGGQTPPVDAGGSIAEVEAARTDPRKVMEKCTVPGCGKMITKKNMEQHRRNIHKLYKRGPRGKGETAIFPADELPKPAKKGRLTANEIVLTVVQMRWPNGVPINKIEALFEWQRETERFLNE